MTVPLWRSASNLDDRALDGIERVAWEGDAKIRGIQVALGGDERNQAERHALHHRARLSLRAGWQDHARTAFGEVEKSRAVHLDSTKRVHIGQPVQLAPIAGDKIWFAWVIAADVKVQ